MGRQPCCDKVGLKRGPWTIEEDNKLMNFILNNGIQCWRLVPKFAGLMRCGKSCRLRWINYLRPDLKRGAWTDSEEDMIIHLHSQLGNRWSKIAAHFPGRTDNEIKNHWNTKIKKKLRSLGLDPLTHKPLKDQNILKKEEETSSSGEETLQSNRGKMVINQNHEQQSLISSTTCSTLDDQESNLYNQMEGSLDDSYYNMGLMNGNHEFQLQEDPFQNWINTPIPWDIFNSHFFNY